MNSSAYVFAQLARVDYIRNT